MPSCTAINHSSVPCLETNTGRALIMLRNLLAISIIFVAVSTLLGVEDSRPAFPTYADLSSGELQVRLLPGTDTFTFTNYGCPGQLEAMKALVTTMKREQLGNGFDPGPGVHPANRALYEYLREIGWPVVGYAQTADHQVKEGTCRLSPEQDRILRLLDDADIFAATQLGEWGYYFHNLSHRESWWRAVYGDSYDQQKRFMKPAGLAGYDSMPSSRRECHETIRDYFQTRQRSMRNWNLSITGHSHYEAYVGQWGARVIGLELGENIGFTQSKIAFAGAARRNALPWSIQVSQWFAGSSTSSGPLRLIENGTARGLDAGHSLNFYERIWKHAWFAGTAMVTPESSIAIFFESERPPYKLTSHGRKASRIFQFMQSKDRGVPYTPIAIVLDQYCGYNAYMGKPWGILTPSDGDLEVRDLFQDQLFPASDHIHRNPFPDNPEAAYLRPTPFGESFDVQLSDTPLPVLASYPVLLLVGDHRFEPSFVKTLNDALVQGARVLLGQRQVDVLGAENLSKLTSAGGVEILQAWINPATRRPTAISNERLGQLANEYQPIGVRGDPVLYQINRTSRGWVIELVNNDGVTKFPTQPAVVDANAVATVAIEPRVRHNGLFNWSTGAAVSLTDGRFPIRIAPGDSLFLELVTE